MAFDPSVLLGNLQSIRAFDLLFPFLLTLAIVYGVLEFSLGTQGEGDKKKRILPKPANGLIALIAAFFVMNYSGGLGQTIAMYFSNLFGSGLVIASAILVIIILLGLTGFKLGDIKSKETSIKLLIGVIVLIGVAVFMWSSGVGVPGVSNIYLDQSTWTFVIFIVILALVLWFLGREEGKKE